MIGRPFSDFVRCRVDFRNESLAEKEDRNIEIDPMIMDIITNSTAVSTMKGRSTGLLKIGVKRRRTRAELEELKLEELHRLADASEREDRISELERELSRSK